MLNETQDLLWRRLLEFHLYYLLFTVWKVSVFRVFLVRIFPAFGLSKKIYGVNLLIQSECGKLRTRKTLNTDTFYTVISFTAVYTIKNVHKNWNFKIHNIKSSHLINRVYAIQGSVSYILTWFEILKLWEKIHPWHKKIIYEESVRSFEHTVSG